MPFKKSLKKAYKTGKKMIKSRYGMNKRSKGLNYGQMASDVLMLKKMVNAEKKFFNYKAPNAFTVGQVDGTSSTGAYIQDVTPLIDQGLGPDSRNGASVKLHSSLYQFQITQQSAVYFPAKLIIEFWLNKGQPLDNISNFANLFAPSQFSGVVDTNSPRNQDRFSDYQLIRRVIKTVPGDQVATGDLQTITFDVPIKYNRGQGHHIRLTNSISGTAQNDVLNGQIFMTIRCSVGNRNVSLNSTRDVPYANLLNSGQSVRFAYKTWFYDN